MRAPGSIKHHGVDSVEQGEPLEAEGFREAVGFVGTDAQREDTTPTVRRMTELEISKIDAR